MVVSVLGDRIGQSVLMFCISSELMAKNCRQPQPSSWSRNFLDPGYKTI